MAQQDRLELRRRDLQRFVLDEVLGAVDDVDFAVAVLADVAGAEPAVEQERRPRCSGVVVVAARDDGAFDEDLAGGVGRDVVERFVDDPAGCVRLGRGMGFGKSALGGDSGELKSPRFATGKARNQRPCEP
jgi:hypothetical protein